MKIKIFCMVVLCTGLLVGCDKERDEHEPEKPPIENPDEPDNPTTPPSTDEIIKTKIGDITMIVGTNSWDAIAYGNGKYVAVGGTHYGGWTEDTYTTTSTDGINWSTPKVFSDISSLYKIVFVNGKFIANGRYDTGDGMVASSTDGINWTKVKVGYANIRGIAFGNGAYVVTNGDFIYVSSDLITWDFVDEQVSQLLDIIFVNGKFVASCNNGYLLSSVDGKTWITLFQTDNTHWRSITYGNGKFVAVGCENYAAPSPGKVIMSTNGTTWTNPKQITPNRIYSVRFINGKFIAVGEKGYITASTDGENWTTSEQIKDESGNIVTAQLNGVCAMP